MDSKKSASPARAWRSWRSVVLAGIALFLLAAYPASDEAAFAASWAPFDLLTGDVFGPLEKLALVVSFFVAVGALVYAAVLGRRVYAAPAGTERMREIAAAVREGANAYLRRQFTTVAFFIVAITLLLIATKWPYSAEPVEAQERTWVAIGRGLAFLVGALFSATVGFCGMRLATAGNLRVAAAARDNFGEAFRVAYRTGTVTGMLTVGLGLLGGTLILLIFGEKGYSVLLGYGFGGSLLALFMRVGGGIYTKAADVGADLVGKVEKDLPEDDPRNAATIADNVGDNVGDCAGMAADVFESYIVTMVAAVMLGYAAFGPKGMIFPVLVQAVGAVSSMISTALVGRGMREGNSAAAMRSINHGFWRSAGISTAGFMLLGLLFLNFDAPYIARQALERGLYEQPQVQGLLGLPEKNVAGLKQEQAAAREARSPEAALRAQRLEEEIGGYRREALAKWDALAPEQKEGHAGRLLELAGDYLPLPPGLHFGAALACLLGIALAIGLNRNTEYWTSTDYGPVKSIAKSCRTGHATNIISGIAVGYESSVWAVLLIAGAIVGAVMIFADTGSPLIMAFGVAMVGIGMLCLTGDTISMDVFGPVADNANGIGEMGYNRDTRNQPLPAGHPDAMPEDEVKRSRQILTDLDAVGNTTKAITKGIAIGSAVIAAVSLFASFIAVLITGSEEKVGQLTTAEFQRGRASLTVAEPSVFIGMLIGGAVPLLFSSMTIRAVGRAAYLIVNECRRQLEDPEIVNYNRKPDYGRVVNICTYTAQQELIGPGLLAIFAPMIVGFALGPFALGGFLAGMILTGQLLAVFMSNAGGAWDNAKKMIEDEQRSEKTGKGSEKHKASVTGDTVGDPLKDTAGPAINPLIKVMNLVSLLVLPFVLEFNLVDTGGASLAGWMTLIGAVLAVGTAWWWSKTPSPEEAEIDHEFQRQEEEAIRRAGGTVKKDQAEEEEPPMIP